MFSQGILGDKNIAYAVLKRAYSKGFLNPCWQEQGWQWRVVGSGWVLFRALLLPSTVSWGEDITLRTHVSSLTMTWTERISIVFIGLALRFNK